MGNGLGIGDQLNMMNRGNIKLFRDLNNNSENSGKRTLGIRDKQILYELAKKKCESCQKKIEFSEMQTGHKKAAAKGGKATLPNSVCLCYKCNKLQGTDSWEQFMRKMCKDGVKTVTTKTPIKKNIIMKKAKKKTKTNNDPFSLGTKTKNPFSSGYGSPFGGKSKRPGKGLF